jgi:hypothetical protein
MIWIVLITCWSQAFCKGDASNHEVVVASLLDDLEGQRRKRVHIFIDNSNVFIGAQVKEFTRKAYLTLLRSGSLQRNVIIAFVLTFLAYCTLLRG